MIWFSDTLPAGFTTTNRVQKVYSLGQAEALGILSTVAAVEVLHYQVSEYFRLQPDGELWIGIFDVPETTYDWAEIDTFTDLSNAECRQVGIYANLLDYVAAQATAIQAKIAAQYAKGARFSVIYAPNFPTATVINSLTDLRTLVAEKVTVLLAQDGGGRGNSLSVSKAFSVPALGSALGCISKAKVQQSIGNPHNFDISDGTEMEVLALATKTLISTLTLTQLGGLKDKGYLIARKYTPRIGGSFFERVPTAVPITNDLAWLEYNRVVDKAIRRTETILTPTLQANVRLNSDGTLADEVVGYYEDLVGQGLTQMQAEGEISAFQVLIDPSQNVLATDTLVVTVKIVPQGVTEFITVNIGLTTSVA